MIWCRLLLLSLLVLLISNCGTRKIEPLVSVNFAQRTTAAAVAAQVSKDNLQKNVSNIFNTIRYYSYQKTRALTSIEAEVAGLNYSFTTQEFTAGGYNGVNLVLTKTGSVNPNQWLVVLAHYDSHWLSPGADDNGSACASLIEIARLFSNVTFESTLKLVFVDLEELDILGSGYFVSQIPSNVTVIAAIAMDMLGFTSSTQQNPLPAPFAADAGDFLAVIGEGDSFAVANDYVRNLRRGGLSLSTVVINPKDAVNNELFADLLRSDHAPFWRAGYPAIMVTDTANLRNPNYHKSTDTKETLDFDFLKKITQATVISVYLWGGVK